MAQSRRAPRPVLCTSRGASSLGGCADHDVLILVQSSATLSGTIGRVGEAPLARRSIAIRSVQLVFRPDVAAIRLAVASLRLTHLNCALRSSASQLITTHTWH